MTKMLLSLLLIFVIFNISTAQVPGIDVQVSLGGTLDDAGLGCSQQPTPEGGYILCGWLKSNKGDVTGNHSTGEVGMVKLNINDTIHWQQSYGGPAEDIGLTTYRKQYLIQS